jgi:hypothetical protein
MPEAKNPDQSVGRGVKTTLSPSRADEHLTHGLGEPIFERHRHCL